MPIHAFFINPHVQIIYVREAVVAAVVPHNNLASPHHNADNNNLVTFNTLDSSR